MPKILLVEDDIPFCQMLESFLIRKSFAVETSFSATEARSKLTTEKYDLILTDLRLPDDDGLSLLVEIKLQYPETPVILMTGYSDIGTAVKAIKGGAADYISKPFNPDEVLLVVQNALKLGQQSSSIKTSKIKVDYNPKYIRGISPSATELRQHINLVAPTDMSVLIIGESGTGKEIIAKTIHDKSKRKNQNFIAVDCGTIPKDLAASEFFGHVRGSFTGAVSDKIGYFEAAHQGTLFLDEIGNLSYENQIQLLRALQERKIKPVGSNNEINVDIRVITATNEELRTAIKKDEFREDLYHRINEFSIKSTPLRDRNGDLMLFVEFFLEKSNHQLQKNIIGFAPEVISVFENYSWPGNLRELQNVIKRAVLLSSGDFIQKAVLPHELFEISVDTTTDLSLSQNEKEVIENALERAGNNKSEAARILKITRKTLYNKMKNYGLDY